MLPASRFSARDRRPHRSHLHKERKGGPPPVLPSEVVLHEEDGMKSPCAVNLHNAATVSQQRLGRRAAQLSAARMNEVCAATALLFGV